jgi:hypothetical protein
MTGKPEHLVIADKALEALREAVNAAVKAGNSPGAIRSAVQDQLFGIQHFGNGDVDKMLDEVAKLKDGDS